MRLACLLVPLFPLAARLRAQPELTGDPLVVCEGNGHAARVVAATRPARRAGVRRGMTLPQARALVPRVTACGRDAECERAASDALRESAARLSPRVEDAGEGAVYLDLEGLERLHDDEEALGHALMKAAEQAGLPARAGIADSKLAARVAAEQPDAPTVVPPGETARFLAPLPLARLSPEADAAATLRRWGLASVGDLARLSPHEISSRLGPVGRRLHRQARGIDDRPLTPWTPPPLFREGMELEWPLVQLEPFLFLARAALDRLCRRMAARGLACERLQVSLTLEPEGHHERSIRLPAPTREVKTLLTLVRLDLEAHPPGAPVSGFVLVAHPDAPREVQLSLLGPPTLSPDRLATTLARLFALLGPGRAGSPRPVDEHRPEAFRLVDFTPPPPGETPPADGNPPGAGATRSRGLLTLRAVRPPLPVEVVADGAGKRPSPTEIQPVVTEETAKRPHVHGRVRVASGPWNLEASWWQDDPVDRDYWDVELTDGGIYRLYRERGGGEWFVDGVYD